MTPLRAANVACLLMALTLRTRALFTDAQDHDVRLSDVGGKQGRVEVLNNGVWGTVCREGWDFYDALVVCKQLGFWWLAGNGWQYDAGNGTGPVWLSSIGCRGSETRLDLCTNDGWTEHNCSGGYSSAAAVKCLDENEFKDADEVITFLRDGGGVFAAEGRVLLDLRTGRGRERFLISDREWDIADANVICRRGGFHSAAKATTNSYFGRDRRRFYEEPYSFLNENMTYLATEFACTGNESNILQCPAQGWFREDYPSGHDAGVICNRIQEPEGFQIRLVNGTTPNEGRIEVYYNGTWGSVCRHRSELEIRPFDSGVICNQLGLGYGLEAPTDGRFGRSSGPVIMSGLIDCDGGEPSLALCGLLIKWMDQSCLKEAGSYDASIICSGPIPESRSPIGFTYSDVVGNLLIFHDGRWGTICNTGWTLANAEVACRELGQGPPEVALINTTNEIGGPIFLEGVSCKGDESRLDECDLGEWYQHTCSHDMDVAIWCRNGGIALRPPASATFTLIVATLMWLYCQLQTDQ